MKCTPISVHFFFAQLFDYKCVFILDMLGVRNFVVSSIREFMTRYSQPKTITMKRILAITFGLVIAFSFNSCKKNLENSDQGLITGKITAENESRSIPDALIFVDVEGEIYYTHTDKNGNFVLSLPEGTHELHVQTGTGSKFRSSTNVTVKPNTAIAIDGGELKLRQTGSLAYIAGAYDNIQDIIAQLGYTATEITIADLDDLNYIAQFDAIFLNCGASGTISNLGFGNLSTYAMNGGSLYASDYAVRYLLGDYTGVCPTARPGGFINDGLLCTEKTGASGWQNASPVVATDVVNFIGTNSIDLEYDLGSWERIQAIDNSFWETIVESPNGEPLMIRTSNFSGTSSTFGGGPNVTVGSNGNSWITICHIPPGNPNNPITITVSANSWAAHQAHGDNLGACGSASNGGTIYYTTFHNHPNSGSGSDVNNIMEYVILNL